MSIMRLLPLVQLVFFLAVGRPTHAQSVASADTLTAQVAKWSGLEPHGGHGVMTRQVLKGATHDLSSLDIRAVTLERDIIISAHEPDADELIIVKEGKLDISLASAQRSLGPGGVALFAAGEKYSVENGDTLPVTYYTFRFRSKSSKDGKRATPPFLIDWTEMVMKANSKGESRQIFSQPVAWLGKIDMHATTLNGGEASHPPHVHRAEEIILIRSGNVEESIDGKNHQASAGDLLFLPSGSLHGIRNAGTGRCEYFALQWLL